MLSLKCLGKLFANGYDLSLQFASEFPICIHGRGAYRLGPSFIGNAFEPALD